ncbi:glutathione S-transferase theta-1-like [Amphiura filiformis]|uniref:glutathione S-transferase theta-1-like n=1 Tax=Amphiura filiformis TaxID=82378 RepID=UPI003B21C3B6
MGTCTSGPEPKNSQVNGTKTHPDQNNSNMGLNIYYFPVSQPSRSIVMFAKLNKLNYNDKATDIFKGEHKTPEYGAINPNHTVPVMDDGGFVICQSVTIVKYLAAKYKVADHWYPSDLKQRARVDELLDWHHSTIRAAGCDVFRSIILYPALMGKAKPTSEEMDKSYDGLYEMMTLLEKSYLKNQNSWLVIKFPLLIYSLLMRWFKQPCVGEKSTEIIPKLRRGWNVCGRHVTLPGTK